MKIKKKTLIKLIKEQIEDQTPDLESRKMVEQYNDYDDRKYIVDQEQKEANAIISMLKKHKEKSISMDSIKRTVSDDLDYKQVALILKSKGIKINK